MKYFVRSVKYLLMLVVVFVAVTYFMSFTGQLELTFSDRMALFMEDNGAVKMVLVVLLAALYPLFGFVKRDVEGSVVDHRGEIIVAMETSGFTLKGESDGKLYFGANTILRRIAFLFEDTITVEQRADQIHIEGIRRGVVYVVYCLDGFIKNSKRAQ